MAKTQTITIPLDGREPSWLEKLGEAMAASGKLSPVQLKLDGNNIVITGIPKDHTLEYLAKSQHDLYYVVHRPTKDWDYDDFRLHIGEQTALVEAKVKNPIRLRDGGTTNIQYILYGQSGEFCAPTHPDQEAFITDTYNGSTLTLLDLLKKKGE